MLALLLIKVLTFSLSQYIIQLYNCIITKEVEMEDFPTEEQHKQEAALSSDEMKQLVVLGRALSDLTRIRILGLLGQRPMYGQELAQALEVSPPTISHHLQPLVSAGLVKVRREDNFR